MFPLIPADIRERTNFSCKGNRAVTRKWATYRSKNWTLLLGSAKKGSPTVSPSALGILWAGGQLWGRKDLETSFYASEVEIWMRRHNHSWHRNNRKKGHMGWRRKSTQSRAQSLPCSFLPCFNGRYDRFLLWWSLNFGFLFILSYFFHFILIRVSS